MLFMHVRPTGSSKDQILPIGNVIDLKFEGDKLTGTPVFDDTDEFAVSIYNKVENGTIRMMSAGLKPREWNHDINEPWLEKSLLKEVSIADIGMNSEALGVALYDDDDNLITLSDKSLASFFPHQIQKTDMKLIQLSAPVLLPMLKLAEGATDAQVTEAIQGLITLAETQAGTITSLTGEKTAAEENATDLQAKLDEQVKLADQAKITTLVEKAETDRKITAEQKPHFIALAQTNYDTTEKLLNSMAGAPTVQAVLGSAEGKDKSEVEKLVALSYDALFASGALIKLKELDLESYKSKHKEKYGVEPKS